MQQNARLSEKQLQSASIRGIIIEKVAAFVGDKLMYHTKKIALFISHIYGEYQKNVCQGVIDKAAEFGFQTEVYATSDGEDVGAYGIGEDSILRIPNFADFSGVILASDTYPQIELKDKIKHFLEENCAYPIIEITELDSCFPTISLENNTSTGTLTQHLITVHNYKRICYLGCSTQELFSKKRERAYRNIMTQHALSVGPNDVFESDFSPESITAAFDFFTDSCANLPDAVICYNDRIALLFMAEVLRAGYKVPEDIALVGCDLSKEGQSIHPCLTSVTFPVYHLGTSAVEQLVNCIRGTSIPSQTIVFAEPWFGASCGCNCESSGNPLFYMEELSQHIGKLELSTFSSMQMRADFSHVTDIETGMDRLEKYVRRLKDCREFYLCLYSDWDSVAQPIRELTDTAEEDCPKDTITLQFALRDEKRLSECTFSKSSLLPEYLTKGSDSAYIISPLFFEARAFGYLVMAYDQNHINYRFEQVPWIMNITGLLQNICEAKGSQLMQDKLFDLYMRDSLTGLYNRHGYEQKAAALLDSCALEQEVTVFLFDMDCLKQINDEHGHGEGDFALRVIGQAIHNTASSDMICTRFGGDEFMVLSNQVSEEEAADFVDRVSSFLQNYNRLSTKPYTLSVSGGFASENYFHGMNLTSLQDLLTIADARMYEQKRRKKLARS